MGGSYSSFFESTALTEKQQYERDMQDYMIYGMAAVVVLFWSLRWAWKRYTGLHKTTVHGSYDYIVVGSGASGCVVAHRLVKEGKKVLLLEAGQDDNLHDMSYYGSYTNSLAHTAIDWCHTSTSSLLKDRKLIGINGKVFGGSGSINESIYQRPSKHELDSLQKIGVKGWSYADCLPFFLKSEGSSVFDDKNHNISGPLRTSFTPMRSPIGKLAADSASDVGVLKNLDSNKPDTNGISPAQLAVDKKGMRCSPATAFIRPILGTKNFTLRTEATVQAIKWNGTKAVGVTWTDRSGRENQTACTEEVILCAGAVGTAAILLRSGVSEKGEVVENKGVGKNLRDLLQVPIIYQTRNGVSFDSCNIHSLMHHLAYKLSGHGPVLSFPVDTLMYLNAKVNGLTGSWSSKVIEAGKVAEEMKNVQHDHCVGIASSGGFQRFDFQRRGISMNLARFNEAMQFNVTGAQRYPPSALHGEVSVDGKEIKVDCCYLRNDDDLKQTVPVVRLLRRMANTDPLKRVLTQREAVDVELLKKTSMTDAVDLMYGRRAIARLNSREMPEDDLKGLKAIQDEIDTEEYLVDYMKSHAQPFNNPVGTCSMAPLVVTEGKTLTSVVDPMDLTLRGAKSLRIADSSILPFPFTAPGTATELMIGERVASMILKQKNN
eukprot:TRINITY_DN11339_c0_g1_i1.p1 TRINITY_DN11339_c0_g1~~TRINITY_DN11339_c0_g1_i1.p1  ORF type:complete len:659 (+),score=142.48 TRINITY_DN11339_c0_g1_i1:43-2019(+)